MGDVRSGKLIRQQQRDLLVAHVAVSALIDLHQLLMDCGFRRSSQDDSSIVQEQQHEEPVAIRSAAVRDPLGLPLERHLQFAPTRTIAAYAELAREHRRIGT